ncbi:MAG: hypothetical protein ACREOI_27935 [bacterium]
MAEKLAMLEALRDQACTIRTAASRLDMISASRPEGPSARGLAGISQQASEGLNMSGRQPPGMIKFLCVDKKLHTEFSNQNSFAFFMRMLNAIWCLYTKTPRHIKTQSTYEKARYASFF